MATREWGSYGRRYFCLCSLSQWSRIHEMVRWERLSLECRYLWLCSSIRQPRQHDWLSRKDVLGDTLFPVQLDMGIFIIWSGYGKTIALGIKSPFPLLLDMAILIIWSGYTFNSISITRDCKSCWITKKCCCFLGNICWT